MARARAAESGAPGPGLGGAANVAPPTDPLALVQAAVAGHDLTALARQTAEGSGHGVAVVVPSRGEPVFWPESAAHPSRIESLGSLAGRLADGAEIPRPDGVSGLVAVTIASEVVGVVTALGPGPADRPLQAWLEAAATAVAVSILMHEDRRSDAPRGFLELLELQRPLEVAAVLQGGRRLGLDLTYGAIGLCALADTPVEAMLETLPRGPLLAPAGAGRLLGLIPLDLEGAEPLADEVVARLRESGAIAARSTPRAGADGVQDAVLEAAVLAELGLSSVPRPGAEAEEETYRLLVGVLLRAPLELARLRAGSVGELQRYDSLHDTDLVATLAAFLAHHGSTTETAEAMSLHRHTVGYRLARVQEVAGLSPYDSDGRERLSLGLKADRLLAAERRRIARGRSA
ncbi:MAG TPA: helix-turn-helix domain-containing protein [Solirubrobacteraceae bacterium]|nr:helix-turn-helix domain-containing protein [Solirubrobacteraceae bacterium]